MLYQRDLKAKWNEYANLTTAQNEGLKAGIEKGRLEGKADFVKKLLLINKLTIAEIADAASVSEDFVEKVRKTLN
jgi:predicted transposase YdaD